MRAARRRQLGLVLLATGCLMGSGTPATETRNVGVFTSVRTEGPVDVVVDPTASSSALEVTCDDNLLKLVKTEIDGRTLVVGFAQSKAGSPRTPCSVRTGQTTLSSIISLGSGDIDAQGALGTLSEVKSLGSGDIEVAMDASALTGGASSGVLSVQSLGSGDVSLLGLAVDELDLKTLGSGDLKVGGVAKRTVATAKGSGDLDGQSLTTQDAVLHTAGSGDIVMRVEANVDAKTQGSGDIQIYGEPAGRTVSADGSGEVVFR